MKLNNFIVCDVVRKEDTNKHLLVGVYSDNVVIKPNVKADIIQIPFTFYVSLRPESDSEKGPEGFTFKVSFDVENVSHELKGNFKQDVGQSLTLVIPSVTNIPFNATKMNFALTLHYSEGREASISIDSMKVQVAQ